MDFAHVGQTVEAVVGEDDAIVVRLLDVAQPLGRGRQQQVARALEMMVGAALVDEVVGPVRVLDETSVVSLLGDEGGAPIVRVEHLAASVRCGHSHDGTGLPDPDLGRVIPGPAGPQEALRALARARVGPGHLEAQVAARHLEVGRLANDMAVGEVDALNEGVAHREDGAVCNGRHHGSLGILADRGIHGFDGVNVQGRAQGQVVDDVLGQVDPVGSRGQAQVRDGHGRAPVHGGGEVVGVENHAHLAVGTESEDDGLCVAAVGSVEGVVRLLDRDHRLREGDERTALDREGRRDEVHRARGDRAQVDVRRVGARREAQPRGDLEGARVRSIGRGDLLPVPLDLEEDFGGLQEGQPRRGLYVIGYE